MVVPAQAMEKVKNDFFHSLPNASLFGLLRSPKSCRCAVQTPVITGFLQALDLTRGDSRPSYSPCEEKTFHFKQSFLISWAGTTMVVPAFPLFGVENGMSAVKAACTGRSPGQPPAARTR